MCMNYQQYNFFPYLDISFCVYFLCHCFFYENTPYEGSQNIIFSLSVFYYSDAYCIKILMLAT